MPVFSDGLELITPTSITSTGAGNSSSISANGSVSFASCGTLSLNGVFSSTYDNYMIVMRSVWTGSPTDNLFLRLRASGTDNTTASSYVNQSLNADTTSVGGFRDTGNRTYIGAISNAQRDGHLIHIYAPFLAQPTAGRSVTVMGGSGAQIWDYAFTHNQSTAYDGFTIYPTSSAITGRVAVYGMRV